MKQSVGKCNQINFYNLCVFLEVNLFAFAWRLFSPFVCIWEIFMEQSVGKYKQINF